MNQTHDNATRPLRDMTMVEIAEQLETVTAAIDHERTREKEARTAYERVRDESDARIKSIRDNAKRLVEEQRSRMSRFDGLLSTPKSIAAPARIGRNDKPGIAGMPANIVDAITAVWQLERYGEPMTTEDLAEALMDVGYKTKASPDSLRSSINQGLAKLVKIGRVVRLRADGSVIPPKDHSSRARKYIAAARLPEGELVS